MSAGALPCRRSPRTSPLNWDPVRAHVPVNRPESPGSPDGSQYPCGTRGFPGCVQLARRPSGFRLAGASRCGPPGGIPLESRPISLVRCRERLEHRPVVRPERVEPMLRGAVPGDELAAMDGKGLHVVAEELPKAVLVSPRGRRTNSRGRRHVASDGLEQLPDGPRRRPVGQTDAAPRPAGANELAAARSWSGANMTPKVESTASKLRSGNGRASASACSVSMVRPSLAARPCVCSRSDVT